MDEDVTNIHRYPSSAFTGCFGCLVAELCDDHVLVGHQGGSYTSMTMSFPYHAFTELDH
jgi:hypothetical protein